MADQIKLIVNKLNEEPFNRSLNLISFDSLQSAELLQLLSDVICTIEQKPVVSIKNEAADETAIRIFGALRIFRFPAPVDQEDLSNFRAGLIEGEKNVVHDVLTWLLLNVADLQQRAYLARFLVHVEIHPEYQGDPEIQQLQIDCDNIMQEFKEAHQRSTQAIQDDNAIEEVRTDLHSMEQEREQLMRRIDKANRKLESVPQREEMMVMAEKLRQASERELELSSQKQEQRNALMHTDQKIARLQQNLRDLRQTAENMNPEEMIQKLSEENTVHRYLLNEKLPKEIDTRRQVVQHMDLVLAQPAMNQNDVQALHTQIEQLNNELVEMADKHDQAMAAGDDKLSIYRHQATIVQRKKDTTAERMQTAKKELAKLELQVQTRKQTMRDPEGNEIVTSVQFKNYVTKLRSKTNIYKKKRFELQDLRAEFGVLARTEEILKARLDEIKSELEEAGETFVGSVNEAGQMARPRTAKPHSQDVQQLKTQVAQLEADIERNRNDLNGVLSELQPLRKQYGEVSEEYQNGKREYNTAAAALESGYAQLEQEVKSMRADLNQAESESYKIKVEKKLLTAQLERAQNEERVDTAASWKQRLEIRIAAAEDQGNQARSDQGNIQSDHQTAIRQMKLWRDLLKILEAKQKCLLK